MHTEKFIRFLKFEKRFSPHTILAYETDLEQFFLYIENQYRVPDVKEITHFFIRSWIVSLMELKTSAKTINRKISVLKSFFRFLLKDNIVSINPMLKIIAPKIPGRLPAFISDESMNLLFDKISFDKDYKGMRDRLILELLYCTGIRRAELIGLKEHSFDFGGHTMKISGKRNKERIIPIIPALAEFIKEYIVKKNEFLNSRNYKNDCLFPDSSGKPLYAGFIYRTVKKYLGMVTTSEKKGPHILRHTFATHMLNNGADINAIKELLGHSSLAATQVYTHNSTEQIKKIYRLAHPKA